MNFIGTIKVKHIGVAVLLIVLCLISMSLSVSITQAADTVLFSKDSTPLNFFRRLDRQMVAMEHWDFSCGTSKRSFHTSKMYN